MGDNYVTDFQGLQWMLADAVMELESAKLQRDKAAWLVDQGEMPMCERILREAKAGQVAGGSDEIVKNEVARHIIRKYKV